MELQIGDKIDRYSDYNRNKADSIMWFADLSKKSANEYTNESLSRRSGTSSNIVYINYPSEGKITESDYVLGVRYEYNENTPKIEWKLESGEGEIMGYDCKKATCYFSGRYYTAWYAPEIPISKGPWKFGGLPGLILKIEDNKDQVSWTCIALEKGDGTHDIIRVDYDPFITNKKEYHNVIADYNRNKLKWIQASGMVKSSIPDAPVKQYPYNAIELGEYAHEKK